jgi:osmotically-inducible protein OsmY
MMERDVMIRTDEQIKKDIVEELYQDYRVDASDVKVEVASGRVTLTGTVPAYTAREAATAATWGIVGVKDVANLLSVRFPATFDVPSDAQIKSDAERRLTWNPDVYSVDIDVSVTGGVVTLEGTVDAYWKRWKAENLASQVRGVIDVENHLAVVPGASFVDKDIATDIETALDRSVYIDAEEVTVKVNEGRVTLSGSVPTYYARARAYEAAMHKPGVVAVDNNVVVS